LAKGGAWALSGLRKSFLDGSLTRLVDPDKTWQGNICEFVEKDEFALGSERQADGSYQRLWFQEPVDPADVIFDQDVFLLTKQQGEALRQADQQPPPENGENADDDTPPKPDPQPEPEPSPDPTTGSGPGKVRVRVSGSIPPEVWSRFGTKILPKLKVGENLAIDVSLSADIRSDAAAGLQHDVGQVLQDLDLNDLDIDQSAAVDSS
jgi:hypothetical protein